MKNNKFPIYKIFDRFHGFKGEFSVFNSKCNFNWVYSDNLCFGDTMEERLLEFKRWVNQHGSPHGEVIQVGDIAQEEKVIAKINNHRSPRYSKKSKYPFYNKIIMYEGDHCNVIKDDKL